MRSYIAFTKKEFLESIRTYKLFVMGIVFLILGMMSPVFAKYTPAIIKSAMPELLINIPEPTAFDSWIQFFKNIGQLGLVTLVIISSGTVANELSRGTLVNMLTKGLSRSTVIFSKFTAAVIIWTCCYILSFAVSFLYTAYFWNIDGMKNGFLSFFSLWLFGVFLVNLVILGGVIFKNIYGSLMLTGGTVVAMTFINISPRMHKYNPLTLSSQNMNLLTGQKAASDFLPAIVITSVLVFLLLFISVKLFNKKQL